MLGGFFKKYFCKKDGTTSLEFSFLFIPYLFLSLGIVELSIMYASASLLEGATGSAARMVRTGQLQQGNVDPETAFRQKLCDYADVLINCNEVQLEVVQMASFNDFDSYNPTFDGDGNLVSQGFDAGGSNDRILIRVTYNYEMLTPLVGTLLAGPSNKRRFVSTLVLQTEPYDFEGA